MDPQIIPPARGAVRETLNVQFARAHWDLDGAAEWRHPGIGNDSLTGGAGADVMTGGTGADRFIFAAPGDFAPGPQLDMILDFKTAEGDKIDVSAINGIAVIAGSAFTFIGAAAFSNVAGQLHYVVNGAELGPP